MHPGLAMRTAVGPLAAFAFFLPWGAGAGPLAAVDFSGYRLVAFTGALEVLVDGAVPTALLFAVRLSILAVIVAAVWHSLLAPVFRWHWLYTLSGWYLAATGLSLMALTILRGDIMQPPSGVLLMTAATALFLFPELTPRIRSMSFANAEPPTPDGSAS